MQEGSPLNDSFSEGHSSAQNTFCGKRALAYKKIWVSRLRLLSFKLESKGVQICAKCRCRLIVDDLESTAGSNSVSLKRTTQNTYTQKKPEARLLGKNKGLPNYDLMTDVFWDSGAQGAFARSSKESPLTDAEEREFGRRQMPSSLERSNPAAVAVGSDSTDNMDDHARLNSVEMVTSGLKRKLGSTSECDRSVLDKKLRIDTTRHMNEAAHNYNRRSKARLDDYLFRFARGDTTKADPPSMTTYLQLLEEACGDVPPSVSLQAYHKFKDADFREAWVHLSTDMRRHLALTNFFDVLP